VSDWDYLGIKLSFDGSFIKYTAYIETSLSTKGVNKHEVKDCSDSVGVVLCPSKR
jgi:hypothetical protein